MDWGSEDARALEIPSVCTMVMVQTKSGTTYFLSSFRKSTAPQSRQLNILIIYSEQQVDDFGGELNFSN